MTGSAEVLSVFNVGGAAHSIRDDMIKFAGGCIAAFGFTHPSTALGNGRAHGDGELRARASPVRSTGH